MCCVNFNEKRPKSAETELSDCLPWCPDWRLLLFMTPMLRATQIGSGTLCDRCLPWRSVPGMSAAGTHTKRRKKRGGGFKRETGGARRKRWMAQEKRKQRGRGKQEGGVCLPSEVGRQATQRRDPLCHVSVRQQPALLESDTTSLDIPQAVTPTLADPGEEQEDSHALQPSPLVHFSKISSEQAGRLAE